MKHNWVQIAAFERQPQLWAIAKLIWSARALNWGSFCIFESSRNETWLKCLKCRAGRKENTSRWDDRIVSDGWRKLKTSTEESINYWIDLLYYLLEEIRKAKPFARFYAHRAEILFHFLTEILYDFPCTLTLRCGWRLTIKMSSRSLCCKRQKMKSFIHRKRTSAFRFMKAETSLLCLCKDALDMRC